MEEGEWVVVAPRKKKQGEKRDHLITRTQAFAYQKNLDIAGLQPALLSQESQNLQNDGWKFDSVHRGTDGQISFPTFDCGKKYTWIPVGNKWGDIVVFSKPSRLPSIPETENNTQ
jgi:hypothetical protein